MPRLRRSRRVGVHALTTPTLGVLPAVFAVKEVIFAIFSGFQAFFVKNEGF